MAPVTVFLVAIACLLTAAAAVRPLALRSGVPEAVWLILLGVGLRATGLVSQATIAALAPFFAAVALIIVLFEAGRDMVFGAGGEQVGRARKLALVGAALVVPLVALFSVALAGLQLLPPVWGWTHALMLGALMLCTAPEVYAPTLYRRADPGLVATLEREAAVTGALAIAATAVCIDLLSLRVPAGKAYAAIAAGFGLGLAFGAFAGLLWITAIRRVGPGRGVYPYTLAAILALYVVTDTLGGIGALAVLVFGAVVSNAGPLVAALFRPRGTVVEAADEDFRAALDDHGRTVEITRVLLFTFIGLGLGPPWGLVAMGIVLGLLLVVLRLLAARLVLRGVDDRTFSALALGWPRGMLVAGLAALPWAAAVPGTESLTTLVFAAVATTCVAFSVAVSPLGHAHLSQDMSGGQGPGGQEPKDMPQGAAAVARAPAPAPTVDEVLGEAGRGGAGARSAGTEPAGRAAAATGPVATATNGGLSGKAGTPAVSGDSAAVTANAMSRESLESGLLGETAVREAFAVELLPSGRTVVPEEPVVSGRTVVPEEPVVSGRTMVPEEPVVSGRTVVPEEPVVSGRTVVPEEPVVTGRTVVPEEPVVTGRTVVPEEPVVSGGTLVPGEQAPLPRFAPPGAPRSAVRTIFRGSGSGAPELVRHVFISAPAATPGTSPTTNVVLPVTRAPEPLSGASVADADSERGLSVELLPGTPVAAKPPASEPEKVKGVASEPVKPAEPSQPVVAESGASEAAIVKSAWEVLRAEPVATSAPAVSEAALGVAVAFAAGAGESAGAQVVAAAMRAEQDVAAAAGPAAPVTKVPPLLELLNEALRPAGETKEG
ncbi:cation:proton antiporter [Nannocystis sp. SCPEA4]|uniref:cation:proton antiporter n=1 Tax=Nannocystis sp. SCPEA4 TaxID=2996787 RepID=UPI0022711EE5|nr:cation:proton antiporter [Nannocystis sp. SCPEA4]MCY1060809.1 cation:proton antiporter [Nannocystis sp. SCPEA4]